MTKSKRPHSRFKNQKIRSIIFKTKKFSRGNGITLNCHHEPTSVKILKLLSKPLDLGIRVWKNGRKVREFETNCASKKIDIEFRGRRWYLKDSKSQTSKNCLIQLLAKAGAGDPKFSRKEVFKQLGQETVKTIIYECTWAAKRLVARNSYEAAHLIEESQGIMCSDITVAWPRIGAEKPGNEVNGNSNLSDCVQIASLKIPGKRLFAFLSYNDQNYFLYKTLRKYEMQKALREFCDLEWEALMLYIPLNWVFEKDPDYQCSTWVDGDRDSKDKIVALRIIVKHRMGFQISDKIRLVIHTFVPIPEDDDEVLPDVRRPVIVGKPRPFRNFF